MKIRISKHLSCISTRPIYNWLPFILCVQDSKRICSRNNLITGRSRVSIIVLGSLLIKGLSVVHGEDARRFRSYHPYVRAILKLSKSRLLSSGRTILLFKHVYFHVKEATYLTKSWSEANHSGFFDLQRLSNSNYLVLYESYIMSHWRG